MEPYVEISLKNIVDNYRKIKEYTSKNIIAVIKDNAYGHGLIKVGQALSQHNVFMLCVSSLSEAISLRKNCVFSPILLLGYCDDAKLLYSFKITVSITSIYQLEKLVQTKYPLQVHLEVETGMHRLGLSPSELDKAMNLIQSSNLVLKGIYTHFCDEDISSQEEQFTKALAKFTSTKGLIIHAQASSYLNLKLDYCNTLRCGLSLYGYSDVISLKHAMNLWVPIIRVYPVSKGEKVGYQLKGLVNEDGYIITIPWGYALGLSSLKNMTLVSHGASLTQCGKMCMDLMMLYTKFPLKIGDKINILSNENIDLLLKSPDTSIYYLLASINPSIQRIYRFKNEFEE